MNINREKVFAIGLSIAAAVLMPFALAYGVWLVYDARRREERDRRERRIA